MAVAAVDPGWELEERIASVMGVINAASAELVGLIGEALATDAWQGHGIRSAEQWVALQCGLSHGRAAGLVATARGLAELPACRGLFQAGGLSEDQARVLAGRVDPAHDEQAAALARACTVSQLRKAVSLLPPPVSDEPARPDGPEDEQRDVVFGNRANGRWWCKIELPSYEGAIVQTALEQGRDAEFRLRHPDAADDPARPVPSDVSWADGLLRMAEAALANLDPAAGRPGERFQVYLHVRADAPMSAYLHLAPSLSDTVRRYLTCDAPIRFVFEADGRIVALSHKQDTVDTKTRKLIEQRDGGCRMPGCAQRRWLHIHHIVHREDGGATVLENLCALCPTDHRLHHAGLIHISGDPTRPDGLTFTDPNGRRIGPAPPRQPGAPPRLAARRLGIPDGRYQHPEGGRADWRWLHWG